MTSEGLHLDFDPERWVTAAGYEGRLYLGYNPHTHAGRIGAWVPSLGHATRISTDDIVEASSTAQAWLDGYLAGSEPSAGFMFGSEIYDLPDDHPRWQRWRIAVASYRSTGNWTGGHWTELTPIVGDVLLPAWTRRGDEIWTWDGQKWEAPKRGDGEIDGDPGHVCEKLNAHSMAVIDERHLQCEECGLTDEVLPDT